MAIRLSSLEGRYAPIFFQSILYMYHMNGGIKPLYKNEYYADIVKASKN